MLTVKKTWAIMLVAVAFVLGVTAAEAKVLESKTKHFYITLDGDGVSKTIALFDPFRVFVQCQVNRNGKDKIKIFVKSSAGGWFVNDRNGPLAAGKRVALFSEDETTGEAEYTDDDGEGSAAAGNGAYLSIDGETLGLGLNVFGHDCVAIGTVTFIRGDP
jgi:hypothetical protein